MKNGDIYLLQILNSSSAMFVLRNNLVTFNQLWTVFCMDSVGPDARFCWMRSSELEIYIFHL